MARRHGPDSADPGRLDRSGRFRSWIVPATLVAVGTVGRLPQLGHSLDEMHGFRQAQTALVAEQYAAHGINLLHTPLPVFGPGSDVPMEFPLVQGAAALVMRFGPTASEATRIISLVGFQVTAILLFTLVRRWHGTAVAIAALALFEFLPLGLAWGASSLIEYPAVALALVMVLGLDRWFDGGRWPWLALGAAGAWLAFLTKSTTAPVWTMLVIAAGLAALSARGRTALPRVVVGGLVGPAAGLVLALGWTRYADTIKERDPLTRFLTSSALTDWNFGTAAQRADPQTYTTIVGRVAQEGAGVAVVVGVLAAALAARSGADRLRRLSWAFALLSGPLVFLNLYWVHNYYLSAIYPAMAVLAALGVVWVARVWHQPAARAATASCLVLLLLGAGWFMPLGRQDVRQWWSQGPASGDAQGIRQNTPPGSKLVMIGCDWNPLLPYETDRVAVMFRGQDAAGYWRRTGDIGSYQYLFSCAPSLNPHSFVPRGTVLRATPAQRLWRIGR